MQLQYKNMTINIRDDGKSVDDSAILKEVFESGEYDICMPALTSHSEAPVFLDIWANIGFFTLKYHTVNPKAKRYLFEPMLENYELLAANLQANNIHNAIAYNFGLLGWKTQETRSLHIADNNNGWHSIYPIPGSTTTKQCVFKWIDARIEEQNILSIHFAKIDCEGSEFDILMNSPVFISRTQAMIVELHYFEKWGDDHAISYSSLLDFLSQKGYTSTLVAKHEYSGEWVFYILFCTRNG